jgi:hypothetical protein
MKVLLYIFEHMYGLKINFEKVRFCLLGEMKK